MYRHFFKRVVDFVLALFILLIFLPILFVIIVLLAVVQNNKVVFIQDRPGKNGKTFKLIKFKTMNDQKDKNGKLLPDNLRLTKVGKFIRSTSLDELPQLLNVLKGDMSLIGPRPLLVKYLPLYTKKQSRRHEVKPGITGWAQVNGRNAISWEQKFDYDVWYVDNLSLTLDVKIIYLTLIKVCKREGISGGGLATVEAFKGSNYEE
jgi:lipopolysaccharide/colanic/teichoic acid biosynthesis glycosyltransferase